MLKEYENSEDGLSSHRLAQKLQGGNVKQERTSFPLQPGSMNFYAPPQTLHNVAPQDLSYNAPTNRGEDIIKVMQNQNVITELLVKQQKQSQLPVKDIPVFRGDALQYKSFSRAFEHSIEQKTDNDQDRLYFLEQFTAGEPQELVRSCAHMPPSKGYYEAKRLLHKHYGDELQIASAYIDKALKWPQIKSDNGKSLSAYAMFLVGCRNSMEDIDLDEMDNPTNLRTVVSKLPYKMKERWRTEAFDIKERRGRRARFADLVSYIDRQAKIMQSEYFCLRRV